MPASISLPAEAAEKALAGAEEAGVPRDLLLRAAGLDGLGERLTFASLCAIYERAAQLSGDEAFGLHVGERTSPRMYGRLGYVAAHSTSFGEALKHLVAFQRLWTNAAGIELTHRRDSVRLRYWHEGGVPPEQRRHESEQMLSALLAFARWALDEPVNPKAVRFEHHAPADTSEHERIFGAAIVFGVAATEIVLPAAWLARPVAQADPALGEIIREHAQSALAEQLRREPLLDRLHAQLHAAIMASQEVSLADAAAALGLGPRTLQRRLAQRGLTFRNLADEARIEVAQDLLRQRNLALAQIAFRLGYSQTSAFHRAFRRLTGLTPGEFVRSTAAAQAGC